MQYPFLARWVKWRTGPRTRCLTRIAPYPLIAATGRRIDTGGLNQQGG
jgi:hypothetical protein